MINTIAYLAILLPFGLLDAVWLSLMGPRLYKPTLGDILLANVNVPAAVSFYLLYPIGILVFATLPALKAGSVAPALIYAAPVSYTHLDVYKRQVHKPGDRTREGSRRSFDLCLASGALCPHYCRR